VLCCPVQLCPDRTLQYLLQGMRLSVAAGGRAWLAVNASMAAWNAYLPLLQKERYADLAGLLLSMLQVLLQVSVCMCTQPCVFVPEQSQQCQAWLDAQYDSSMTAGRLRVQPSSHKYAVSCLNPETCRSRPTLSTTSW
jgi:hypothetical protein